MAGQGDSLSTKAFVDPWLSSSLTIKDIARRPYLLLGEPTLFVAKPMLIAVLFPAFGLVMGAIRGIRQGLPHGIQGVLEGGGGGAFVAFVMATICGGMLAAFFWGIRTILRIIYRKRHRHEEE